MLSRAQILATTVVVTLFDLGVIFAELGTRPKQEAAHPKQYLGELRTELSKAWPNNRRIVVVCHGHSVPAGYFATPEVRPFDSYPHLLHLAINGNSPTSVTSVICTGVGGENSEQGAARFDEDVLTKKPDVVTIDYSLNDRSIGLRRARRAWTSMIEKSLESNVKVILLTPSPDINADVDNPKDPLVQQAQQVRELAARYHVGLVDSLAVFRRNASNREDMKTLMAQSNHPNRKGHELIAKELCRYFVTD